MRTRCWVIVMVAGLFMVFMGKTSEAGINNSKHDMFTQGKGTDPNVCSYCHVPHNAVGEKIWSDWGNEAQLANGPSSTIGNMCYTCHDGTATTEGQLTAFNTALQQHKVVDGADCDMCHTVHDNTNGKFLGVVKTNSANTEAATYCETCHDSTPYPGAEQLGDHIVGAEHPYKDAGPILDSSCNSCHLVHGAANYSAGAVTHPILRQANTDSAYCATCHPGRVQNSRDGNKHPANLAAAGNWGKVTCQACHDPHQPQNPTHQYILLGQNLNSGYCTTCHQAQDNARGPQTGSHSHPIGEDFATVGLTPNAREIDDDNDGPDYPGNSATIVCETCHSVHSKGVDGPLTRISLANGALCVNCHNNK